MPGPGRAVLSARLQPRMPLQAPSIGAIQPLETILCVSAPWAMSIGPMHFPLASDAMGLISQDDRGTYLCKKELELRVWIPLRLWVCMFMALICFSSVLSASQNLHLDSTLLGVYKPSNYFPRATSCHFCALIKLQLLALSNFRFLSVRSIPVLIVSCNFSSSVSRISFLSCVFLLSDH